MFNRTEVRHHLPVGYRYTVSTLVHNFLLEVGGFQINNLYVSSRQHSAQDSVIYSIYNDHLADKRANEQTDIL